MEAFVVLTAPFLANRVEAGALNAVRAQLEGEGSSAFNWTEPGDFDQNFAINLDSAVQKSVIDASHRVTGA